MQEDQAKNCCTPTRDNGSDETASKAAVTTSDKTRFTATGESSTSFYPQASVVIPAGKALVGTKNPIIRDDGEGRVQKKAVKSYRISATSISNATFARFVEETGYVTEAESIGWSFVFHSDVSTEVASTQGVVGTEWWRKVHGADWRQIHGPNTKDRWKPEHPVVQVSWNDAWEFARWCGARLPTEAEWEHAARGGLGDVRFPWGDKEPDDTDFMPCNIWQGRFPNQNTAADGWSGTAPADAYEPNAYGLYNLMGNVWEWTADPFLIKSLKKSVKQRMTMMRGFKLLKGGSYLCHQSYCYRYRIAARTGNSPDSSTSHQGFRVVWDI